MNYPFKLKFTLINWNKKSVLHFWILHNSESEYIWITRVIFLSINFYLILLLSLSDLTLILLYYSQAMRSFLCIFFCRKPVSRGEPDTSPTSPQISNHQLCLVTFPACQCAWPPSQFLRLVSVSIRCGSYRSKEGVGKNAAVFLFTCSSVSPLLIQEPRLSATDKSPYQILSALS